mmetsp:Transcript_54932/g.94730  ORF Transcript_54932/g.94730 Transcript_54932/m.94730 type:complete len:138 (+) Transcript_54932:3-416(+)
MMRIPMAALRLPRPVMHASQLLPFRCFSDVTTPSSLKEIFGLKSFEAVISNEHSGREWRLGELRRKSFEDLHKLWVVLYIERNALMTYLTKSKRNKDKPKTNVANIRIRKVKDSMQGIKAVLGERRAAFKLMQARTE